jgi:pyrroloquinoline-quinone synthase
MDRTTFWKELEQRVAAYDLLRHPFYQAWSNGELTQEDLREYASEYYHHVTAFPHYLSTFARRLPEGDLRRLVLKHCREEIGHDEMWLGFAAGMGAQVDQVRFDDPIYEIKSLIATYMDLAQRKSAAAALASFYVYESQVPRIAHAKEEGLRKHYQADDATCRYFTLHQTADVAHAHSWKRAINREFERAPQAAPDALEGAEEGAKALWQALDGIEKKRKALCGCR